MMRAIPGLTRESLDAAVGPDRKRIRSVLPGAQRMHGVTPPSQRLNPIDRHDVAVRISRLLILSSALPAEDVDLLVAMAETMASRRGLNVPPRVVTQHATPAVTTAEEQPHDPRPTQD